MPVLVTPSARCTVTVLPPVWTTPLRVLGTLACVRQDTTTTPESVRCKRVHPVLVAHRIAHVMLATLARCRSTAPQVIGTVLVRTTMAVELEVGLPHAKHRMLERLVWMTLLPVVDTPAPARPVTTTMRACALCVRAQRTLVEPQRALVMLDTAVRSHSTLRLMTGMVPAPTTMAAV